MLKPSRGVAPALVATCEIAGRPGPAPGRIATTIPSYAERYLSRARFDMLDR